MIKSIKKVIATLIATIMAFAVPITVFASVDPIMTLEPSSTQFFAGTTYQVTATVSNLTEAQVIGFNDKTVKSAFTWNITGKATTGINSLNDYSQVTVHTDSADTYTVTEKASFTMPISNDGKVVPGDVVVTSSYGTIDSKEFTISTTLQPITSLTVSSDTTDHTYYDNANSCVYVDQGYTMNFNVTTNPSDSDDTWDAVSSDALSGTTDHVKITKDVTNNTFSANVSSSSLATSTIKISPDSGYSFQETLTLYKCIPLTGFNLNYYNSKTSAWSTLSLATKTSEYSDALCGSTNVIAGDDLILNTGNRSTSNDKFKYEVFTDSTLSTPLSLSNYTMNVDTTNANFPCTISFNTAGTYYVKCSNYSLDGGHLARDLVAVTKVTVTEANPITTLGFYELNDTTLTDTPLDSITLYTNSSTTYDVSKNLKMGPDGYTDSVAYYSADTSIATVSATGLITAKKSGTVKICAQSTKGGIQAFLDVNVVIGIIGINSISATYKTLPLGHSETLSVVTNPTVVDETISWSCNNNNALILDAATGKITANPDYDFAGSSKVTVTVTATSEFGKQSQTYIDVVPAVRADIIDVDITSSADIETMIEDEEYSLFTGSTFTLTPTATDSNGNPSNDVLEWKVSVDDKDFMSTDDMKNYLTYVANADGSFTITTKTTKNITFFIYGTLAGENFNANNERCKQITIYNKAIITGMSIINPDTGGGYTGATLTTGGTTNIVVKLTNDIGYNVDQLHFASSDESIATVVQTGINTATITAVALGLVKINVTCDSGSKTAAFTLTVSNNIALAGISGINESYTYTGSAITPVATLGYNNILLYINTDYTTAFTNNINAGLATITYTGKNTYANSKKIVNFTIEPKTMSNDNITVNAIADQKLSSTVTAATPAVVVKDTERNNATLRVNTDYTVTYSNNTSSGVATATINGIGNYSGSVTANFNVIDTAQNFTIGAIADQYKTGAGITPSPKVYYHNVLLTKGVDYTLSYSNNVNVGTATVKVTGIGAYNGYTTATFKINPAAMAKPKASSKTNSKITLTWTVMSGITGYQIYNVTTGKLVTISNAATTSYTFSSLSAIKKYQFKIRQYYKNASTGVTYYGAYSSVYSVYTNPKATSVSSLSTKSKTITVKWKKVAYTGYQVQYSTSSSMSGAKTLTISGGSKTSNKISKLKKGKKYYIRVRTYKTISGKKYYSSWSAKKSIKCK